MLTENFSSRRPLYFNMGNSQEKYTVSLEKINAHATRIVQTLASL